MKKLQLLSLVALMLMGLLGCEKAKVENEAAADVFIKAIKKTDGTTAYTAIYSVFSYNLMSTVGVTTPAGLTTQLKNFEDAGNSFFNEPVDGDFLASPPDAGSYVYSVKFKDGEEKLYTNVLTSSYLLPANITSLSKNASGDSVYIKWDAIAGAHAYQLKITKGSTQVFYEPSFTDVSSPPKTSLRLGYPLSRLMASGSDTYTFVLTGLLFESTEYELLQAISTSAKTIIL